jgi:HSP20 family molecular chaperone IbpA
MTEKTIARAKTQNERTSQPEGTRTRERFVSPPVDIYEVPGGLVVMADVPGVTHEHLDIRVDNHVLTIRGQIASMHTAERIYNEYDLVNYFRQFELSDKVNDSKIEADLKHGVLTLRLLKAEEARPRKIAVAIGS